VDDPVAILEQVKGVLDHWSLEPVEIDVASQSENIVYKVTTLEGNFALRIHRPGYHTLEELNAEHEWTGALSQAGFLLPTTRPATTGEFYIPVEVNGGTRYAGLIEWLDGSAMKDQEDDEPTDELNLQQLSALGELIAKLHNHSSAWQHSVSFTRHHLDVDGFFGPSPFWGRYWESPSINKGQRALLLSTQNTIAGILKNLGKERNVFGMIHADLHRGNVFISHDKMYLIDFDDAGFGWYLYDIAVALYEYNFEENYQTIEAAFLDGYTKHRVLADAHRALLPMFLHIRSRAIIGWATARPELKQQALIDGLVQQTCKEAVFYG
jgi:Ser/Thr protein kinase RdoA (MazF antagonist)